MSDPRGKAAAIARGLRTQWQAALTALRGSWATTPKPLPKRQRWARLTRGRGRFPTGAGGGDDLGRLTSTDAPPSLLRHSAPPSPLADARLPAAAAPACAAADLPAASCDSALGSPVLQKTGI